MQRYDVLITPDADNDLERIFEYIYKNLKAPETAETIVNNFYDSIQSLESLPLRYSLSKDSFLAGQRFRTMPVDNYIIFYVVDNALNKVIIHRVIYAKRNYKKLFCLE